MWLFQMVYDLYRPWTFARPLGPIVLNWKVSVAIFFNSDLMHINKVQNKFDQGSADLSIYWTGCWWYVDDLLLTILRSLELNNFPDKLWSTEFFFSNDRQIFFCTFINQGLMDRTSLTGRQSIRIQLLNSFLLPFKSV